MLSAQTSKAALAARLWWDVSKNLALLLFSGLLFAAKAEPADSVVMLVQEFIRVSGLFVVLVYPLFWAFLRFVDGEPAGLYYLGLVIPGLAAYSAILWAVGLYGTSFKTWALILWTLMVETAWVWP